MDGMIIVCHSGVSTRHPELARDLRAAGVRDEPQ
mgnify:CR=1 FL=1